MDIPVQAIHCFLGGIFGGEINFSKRKVHHPKDSDVVYAFGVPWVHVSDSL